MPIRQSTIEKYKSEFTKFNVSTSGNHVVLECKECLEKQSHTVPTLSRRISEGSKTECTSYQCSRIKVSGDFKSLGCGNIECNACGLVYHMEKKVRYFECYCNIQNKQTEHALYKKLINNGFTKLSRESYWNRDITNHKCDILVHHENGKYIYIEVDDLSHFSKAIMVKDRVFNNAFKKNRLDNEHLIRVMSVFLDDPDYIEEIIQKLNDPNVEAFITL